VSAAHSGADVEEDLACTSTDQLALKLSQAPEHRQHEATMWDCRVRSYLMPYSNVVKPVTLPPGRAKLLTKPAYAQFTKGLHAVTSLPTVC
jgi:hypothetical protein